MPARLFALAAVVLVTFPAARAADEEKAVRAVLEAQVVAWNKGDLDGFMAGYWNDEKLSFISGGDITSGWKATKARYEKRYKAEGKEMGKLTFSELHVEVLSPTAALLRGKFEVVFEKEKDEKKKVARGRFTLILKKLPDGWKITHDHTSAEAQPVAAPAKIEERLKQCHEEIRALRAYINGTATLFALALGHTSRDDNLAVRVGFDQLRLEAIQSERTKLARDIAKLEKELATVVERLKDAKNAPEVVVRLTASEKHIGEVLQLRRAEVVHLDKTAETLNRRIVAFAVRNVILSELTASLLPYRDMTDELDQQFKKVTQQHQSDNPPPTTVTLTKIDIIREGVTKLRYEVQNLKLRGK